MSALRPYVGRITAWRQRWGAICFWSRRGRTVAHRSPLAWPHGWRRWHSVITPCPLPRRGEARSGGADGCGSQAAYSAPTLFFHSVCRRAAICSKVICPSNPERLRHASIRSSAVMASSTNRGTSLEFSQVDRVWRDVTPSSSIRSACVQPMCFLQRLSSSPVNFVSPV